MMGQDNEIPSIIPDDCLHALAEATRDGKFTMVLIVNQENLDRLNRRQAALLRLEDGEKGCIVLLHQESIVAAYRRPHRRGPGRASSENGGGR